MKTYRMIVKTQGERNGRAAGNTETIRHIPEAEVASRREAVRQGAQPGSTTTVKVVQEP